MKKKTQTEKKNGWVFNTLAINNPKRKLRN